MSIKFKDQEHKEFYNRMLTGISKNDTYRKSFFYTMGISEETRNNIKNLYDFKENCIKFEGLHDGWQTGGSMRISRLALNLFNGYAEKGNETLSTPYELFDCGFAPYFFEAIKLRYPEFCQDISKSRSNGISLWGDTNEK